VESKELPGWVVGNTGERGGGKVLKKKGGCWKRNKGENLLNWGVWTRKGGRRGKAPKFVGTWREKKQGM